MKLIIQIPCFNEETTLPLTIKDLPKKIGGIDNIEVLVIDDGSTDKTVEIAKQYGVDHILQLPVRHGLAEAFRRGIERALELKADIIVNTDGDNQYRGEDIEKLVALIIAGKSEIVIGCRQMSEIKHFSFFKKALQRFGSYMVRKFSNTNIPDTTSGFRAYSRDAALRLNVFSNYTYTIETIIQAGRKEIPMSYVYISTNDKLRESRLIKNIPRYIARSIATMLRIYLMYEPLKSFFYIGILPILTGFILVVRFFVGHFTRLHGGHMQSLIIAAILIVIGSVTILIGMLGDLISANRKLNEEILYLLRKKSP